MTSQTNNHTAVTDVMPLPCPVPWCVGSGVVDWFGIGEQDRPYFVKCLACCCKGRHGATAAEAIANWNTRHNTRPLPDQEAVERVARALARHDNPKHENWWPSYETRARAALAAMTAPVSGDVDDGTAAIAHLKDELAALKDNIAARCKAIGEKPGQ